MPAVSSLAMLIGPKCTLVMSPLLSRITRASASTQVGEVMSTAWPVSVTPSRQLASSMRSCSRLWVCTWLDTRIR